jgi:hypothetical protein
MGARLPNWKPEGGKRYQPKREQDAIAETTTPPTETLDPYISIFGWLWDTCGVRKIFTLEVDDVSDEPHTDVGIREALRGISADKPDGTRDFEIEVWKWKKFDICVETIAKSAPSVHEVHLYSRGNVTILRGWSCRPGVAQLKGLREVHVEIHAKVRHHAVSSLPDGVSSTYPVEEMWRSELRTCYVEHKGPRRLCQIPGNL